MLQDNIQIDNGNQSTAIAQGALVFNQDPETLNKICELLFPGYQEKINSLANALTEKKEELKDMTHKYNIAKTTISDITIEKAELKLQLQTLQNSTISADVSSVDEIQLHDYIYDIFWWTAGTTENTIKYVIDAVNKLLCRKTRSDKYLVIEKSDVIPVFYVLTESVIIKAKYKFIGGISAMCNFWNGIVANLKDKERAKNLQCKFDSIKADYNKGLFERPITSWDIEFLNGKIRGKVTTCKRALNIKQYLESVLKN